MMKAKLKSETNQKVNYIAFQTLIGLRFINKESVVYFEFTKDDKSDRS